MFMSNIVVILALNFNIDVFQYIFQCFGGSFEGVTLGPAVLPEVIAVVDPGVTRGDASRAVPPSDDEEGLPAIWTSEGSIGGTKCVTVLKHYLSKY